MNGAYSLFIPTITFLASSAVVYINMLCNEYQSECVCDCVCMGVVRMNTLYG